MNSWVGDNATAYSHRGPASSYTRGTASFPPTYISIYCWKFLTGISCELYLTFNDLSVTAATSNTRFLKSAMTSGVRPGIPRRA